MAVYGRQFNHLQELLDYLNDVLVSKDLEPTLDLDGLELEFNAGTVTFDGNGLTPNQIVEQINDQLSNTFVTLRNYGLSSPPRSKLAIIKVSEVLKTSGTANALLGLPTTGDDITIGSNPKVKAEIISITENTNRFTVLHE